MSRNSDTTTFSEATRLYAENYDLVELMKKEFESELDAFFDDVRKEAGGDEVIAESTAGGNRTWRLTSVDREGTPYIWFKARQPSIVTSRSFEVCSYLGHGGAAEAATMRSALEGKALPPSCSRIEASRTLLLKLSVSMAGFNEPAAGVAEDLVEVLEVVTRTWHEGQKRA